MREFLRVIFSPTFWQVAARATTGIASFLITIILTRSLGVAGFGSFTAILALVTIFYLPTDFGLNATFIKLANKVEKTHKLFFNLLILRLVWGTILALLALSIGSLLYSANLALLAAAATIVTTAVIITAQGYFQTKLAYQWPFLANAVGSVLTLSLIFLLLPNLRLAGVFGAILVGQLLAGFLNLVKIWQQLKPFFTKIDQALVARYFTQSLFLGLTLVFNLIYFKADIIILSILKPTTSVGLYGVAVKIFEWALLPPALLLNSVFPILARAYIKDLEKFQRVYRNTATILFLSGVTLLTILVFFGDFFIRAVAGEDFVKSASSLKVLALGIPAFYLSGLLMWLLVIYEKKLLLAAIYGGGAAANIILNLIFIPRFDFMAAAVITVVCETVILAVASAVFFKTKSDLVKTANFRK